MSLNKWRISLEQSFTNWMPLLMAAREKTVFKSVTHVTSPCSLRLNIHSTQKSLCHRQIDWLRKAVE